MGEYGRRFQPLQERSEEEMTQGAEKKAQVLLVEDNLTDAMLIRTRLEQDENIRVTLTQDGIRGCQLVEGQRWDLVVTDINLPGRDGIEVILECKVHQPETPIIAISAYSLSSFGETAFRGGADEVFSKPIDRDELLTTVRDLLAMKMMANARFRRILAVGALPGDVEAGCGGTLLKHAHNGDDLTILDLAIGCSGDEAKERRAASKRAAQVLGADLLMPLNDIPELTDLDEMVIRVQIAIQELDPDIILSPSSQDVRDSRKNTFKAIDISASRVRTFYTYQSATTTLDFRPTMFEDISEYLDQKMAALSHFEAQVSGRPHLDPDLARASARHWGRFLGYGEVEPLGVIRQSI
jgi:CheY-like chemotaxis protein/LmbE family N-acetylglucosaminyl deacetylase